MKSLVQSLSAAFLLLCFCANALSMTPGEEFLSDFGVSPVLLETANCVVSITNIVGTTICTDSWTVEFSALRFDESVQIVSFSAVSRTNQTSIVGTVERHETPEDAFRSAAAHICANSLPMYIHTRDWSVSTNATDIHFLHRYPSSSFDDRRISISRNILIQGETSNASSFDVPFGAMLSAILSPPLETDEGK